MQSTACFRPAADTWVHDERGVFSLLDVVAGYSPGSVSLFHGRHGFDS